LIFVFYRELTKQKQHKRKNTKKEKKQNTKKNKLTKTRGRNTTMRRNRRKPNQTTQGKKPTKTTPENTETTTTRENQTATRTRGTKQRNRPPTRNRNTKPEKQKGHKTEKPEKPKRKNETKKPHIKSIKKKKRYFSFFFYINALVGFWCSFEFWLVGLEVWAYKSFSGFEFLVLWWCVPWFLWSCCCLFVSVVISVFCGVGCWSLASYCFVLFLLPSWVSSFILFSFGLVWCCLILLLLFAFLDLFYFLQLDLYNIDKFYKAYDNY
jgi:hypothetical protein